MRIRTGNRLSVYKQIRKQYQDKLMKRKREKIIMKIEECGFNSKKLFLLVNHLTGHKPEIPLPTRRSDKELAEEFASFFLSKIVKIREELDHYRLYQPSKSNIPKFNNFRKLEGDQVRKLVMSTKSKSCELDPILTTLVKKTIPCLLPTITKIINLPLQSGIFPRSWKTAIVIPLLKKQVMELVTSNYRPVNNLPYISKLVEKAMLEQINHHCNMHNLLLDCQLGYRENRSCKTVLLKLTNDILWSMERKNVTVMIVLNLSMAFDTVDHKVLHSNLHNNFGISVTVLEWFRNYLNHSDMTVKIGKSYGERKELTFSVPQGSCCGANLCNMCSGSIREVVDTCLNLLPYVVTMQ